MYRVLYVDDDPALLEIGKLFLERDGEFSVDTLISAPAALSLIPTTTYDAIISDYQMPDMDGIVFLKKVRSEFGDLPFILFTGKGREEVVVQAIDNGVDFYIQKGGDPKAQFTELAHKVRSAISSRKFEIALQADERRLASIYNTVGDVIFQLAVEPNDRYRFCSVNSAFCRVTGLPVEKVIGREVHEIIPEPSLSMVLGKYREAIAKNAIVRWEETTDYPTGQLIGDVSIAPLYDNAGNCTYLIGSVHDITERKVAEQKIRESEERLRFALEGTNDGLWDVNMTTGAVYLSPRGCEILGYTPEELPDLIRVWSELVYEEDLPETQVALSHYLAGKTDLFQVEQRLKTKSGHLKWIHTRGKAVERDLKGQPLRMTGTHTDITDRKRAEDDLRETNVHLAAAEEELRSQYDMLAENQKTLEASEEKYRTILENMQDAYYRTDAKGNVLMLSPSASKILGYASTDMLIGRPATDHYAEPAQRDLFLAALRKEGSVSNVEITLKRKDGTLVIVSTSSHIYYDASGKPAGEEGIFRDITRFKQVQQQLRQSEELYRVLVEHVQGGAFVMQDGRVLFCNRAFADMIGYTTEELIGSAVPGLIAPEDRDMVMERQKSRLAGKRLPESYEFKMLHKDGTTRVPVLLSVGTGNYRHRPAVIGTVRDISEERARDQGLRESEAKYRNLVETSPGMIWEIDVQGKFLYVSPSSGPILGYTPDELVGRSITDLVPVEMRAFALQELSRVVSSGGPLLPFEFPARHRDGRDLTIEIRPSRVTGTDGNLVGLRGVIIDITERKGTEDALRRANHQIQLLTSMTRHDLQNKVTTALGYLSFVHRKFPDPDLAVYVTKLENTLTAIRSQIEFTRVYQAIGSQKPQWQDLADIVKREHVPDTVVLTVDLGGAEVLTDPMLEKVFANLLDNSLRHGEHVTEIRVSFCQSDQGLTVIWEDNGVGVNADRKEKIFERGFGNHTGLGLFLVREILSLTGITIKETGKPGRGARFELLVPKGAYRFF
jgi:PAS domain S-box-containing protein